MRLTPQVVTNLIRTKSQQSPRCLPHQTRSKYNHLLEWSITCQNFLLDCQRLQSPSELAKDKVPFKWGPEHQSAFTQIKTEIASAPILAYYNPKKKTVFQTDASIKGLGTCLLQEEKPVYFATKALTDAQWGYVAFELELLAVA